MKKKFTIFILVVIILLTFGFSDNNAIAEEKGETNYVEFKIEF